MTRRPRFFEALVLVALLIGCLGARRIQGPIWGTVETSDGTVLEDVVVRLRCSSYAIHGAWATDYETRVVATGERFRFLWAWGGLSPIGCTVRAYHPLYVTSYTEVGDDFMSDLGTIRIQSWEAFFAGGPTEPPAHSSYPWPALEIQQHLFSVHHYYVLEHPERSRSRLARYVPALHAIFDRAIRLLPTSWHAGSSWNRGNREKLRDIEESVGWERPADQRRLAEAASAGDVEGLQALLAAGTDPDAWGDDGAAPIHLAAEAGHTEAVRALLDGGAAIDRQREGAGDTALLDALQSHRDQTSLLLIERGADVTLASWRGSPLQVVAAGNARPHVVRALVEHGAVANAREEIHLIRALHTASRRNHAVVVAALLEAGISPDATRGPPGYTALMAAARAGSVPAARLLIDAGADVNARTEDGHTPLSLAREGGQTGMIALLREAGALHPPAPAARPQSAR